MNLSENEKIGLAIAGTAAVGGAIYWYKSKPTNDTLSTILLYGGLGVAAIVGVETVARKLTDTIDERARALGAWTSDKVDKVGDAVVKMGGELISGAIGELKQSVSWSGRISEDVVWIYTPLAAAIASLYGIVQIVSGNPQLPAQQSRDAIIVRVIIGIGAGVFAGLMAWGSKDYYINGPGAPARRTVSEKVDPLPIVPEDIIDLMRLARTREQFLVYLYMYLIKDFPSIVNGNEINTVVYKSGEDGSSCVRLIALGNKIYVIGWFDVLKQWVVLIDDDMTVNEKTYSLLRAVGGLLPSGEETARRTEQLSEMTKNNIPSRVIVHRY